MMSTTNSQWSAKNPYTSYLSENYVLNGEGSGKETRHIVFDLGDSGLGYKAGDALGVIPICPPETVSDLLALGGFSGDEEVETNLGVCSLREALSNRYEVHRVSKKWIEGEVWISHKDLNSNFYLTKEVESMLKVPFGKLFEGPEDDHSIAITNVINFLEDFHSPIIGVGVRRLLNRLSEGGATVTTLARDIGLQIPHASAELRKLRNEGLVSSDLVAGSRGAYLHLTELGWNRIRSDERSRALEALPLPSLPGKFCVLDKDGSNILMGLSSIPKSPMILIPDRPPNSENNIDDSIGNEGVRWNWAVFKEKDPRWFDLQSLKVTQAPPISTDLGIIDTYSGQSSVIGIIRANLINEMSQLAMTFGYRPIRWTCCYRRGRKG